jgi:MinD superfamily P-loop ATPase
MKKSANEQAPLVFIDCPPGSACSVMESIKDADYCVLVAEPTLFGAHNLEMVRDLVIAFRKPHGVVLNKCLGRENPAEDFCMERHIPILGRIPFDTQLGRLSANAKIAAREDARYLELFTALLNQVVGEAKNEAIARPQR